MLYCLSNGHEYLGPRGFLLFFLGKFCDANRFFSFFIGTNRTGSAENREKKASDQDRWDPRSLSCHQLAFDRRLEDIFNCESYDWID